MGLYDVTLTFTVPDDAEDYRDAIPVPAERLPITLIADWFRSQEQTTAEPDRKSVV